MEHTEQQGLTEIDAVPFIQKVSGAIFSNIAYLHAITLYKINDRERERGSGNELEVTNRVM